METTIKFLVSMFGEYLHKPLSAAKYSKWFITARNYLLLLFPLETYPVDYSNTNIDLGNANRYAVPVEAVKDAAKRRAFDIPFIKGI